MMYVPAPRYRPNDPVIHPWTDAMASFSTQTVTVPGSVTWGSGTRINLLPIYLPEPFVVAKAYWCNGATVGTDSIDIGVYLMTDPATGRCDLLRSTGAVLSAGTVSVVQEASAWKVAANSAALTTGADSTDSLTYTTTSVTLKAGRLYLLSFVNTAASAAAPSGIAGGGTWAVVAPGTGTTQFNTAAHRVSIWSSVPTVDYTGTIVITFGATQTGCKWALNEFSGVDTSSNNGIVQAVVGTGSSVTPLATLAAFGSANNATFGALANTADSTTTPGTGFTELSDDTTAVTPAQFLQTEWSVANDTTVDGTITSGPWGAVAVEIKADASSFVIPPVMPGNPNVYMAMVLSGNTATITASSPAVNRSPFRGFLQASGFPLPSTLTAAGSPVNARYPLAGFSSRSLIG